jgi:hypothetical protein
LKKPGFKSLLAMVATVLAVPLLFLGDVLDKEPHDSSPLEKIEKANPHFVFIGDSMLRTRIDPKILSEELGGARVFLLDDDGSGSARWYLRLKNYVAEANVTPKRVFIFFRDWNLSWPAFRTTGRYREQVERDSHEEEPVLEKVLERSAKGWKPSLDKVLRRIYPVQENSDRAHDAMRGRAMRLLKETWGDTEDLDEDLEDTFELRDLRSDVPAEMADEDGPKLSAFSPEPEKSFLPHMIEVAKQNNLELCFVRVKRRPRKNEDHPRQPHSLQSYMRDLEAYFRSEGVAFHDFTMDPDVTLSMYADGDHISEEARPEYTRMFARKLLPLLQWREEGR